MEFSFNINELLSDEVISVDSSLQPCRRIGIDRHGFQRLQSMLYEVVNKMGDASAKAQGLSASITTGRKLEMAGHRLYIMKDEQANGGNGAAVGILKVGTKKLFVYDQSKNQHEVDPLCVLDFYVHESRQRMGCGRKLFDFMLRSEGIQARHLAVDRPSPKFTSFLRKHYRLSATIPQVNNFVIFEGFFNNRTDIGNRNRRRNIGQSIHTPSSFGPDTRINNSDGYTNHTVPSGPSGAGVRHQLSSGTRRNGLDDINDRGLDTLNLQPSPVLSRDGSMGASEMMYSRHGPSPPNSMYQQRLQATPPRNQATPPRHQATPPRRQATPPSNNGNSTRGRSSPGNMMYRKMNSMTSPHMYYNTGMNLNNYQQHMDQQVTSAHPQPQGAQAQLANRGPHSTPNFGNRSRENLDGCTSGLPMQDSVSDPAMRLPDIGGQPPNGQQGGNSVVAHRPPSGKQNSLNRAEAVNPPMMHRGPLPPDYTSMLNMHQSYQSRSGHLNVPARSPAGQDPAIQKVGQPTSDTSWTVAGVLRNHRMNRYNATRLW